MSFTPIIGLEIHIQLNTKTKLFCSCLNEYAPDEPNKNICPFCTGQPGALPSLNKQAVLKAIKFGVAVNATIPKETRWDRKNYFYPDLPAGYQISQYDNPIVEGGKLDFFIENKDTGEFTPSSVNLTRAHLEADAGKSLHIGDKTMVDFNRSGCPLIEIVTEPEIRSANQAVAFASELQLLVRKLGISEADMEKGQMRFDCNISLQSQEQKQNNKLPDYKVEVKNINSFRSLARAIEFEIQRQTKLLQEGQTPAQETRGWKDDLNKSVSQRGKEMAHDYRYFPEPDLRILQIEDEYIPKLEELPKLPQTQRQEYLDLGIKIQQANIFVTQENVGDLFDKSILESGKKDDKEFVKTLANLITVNLIAEASSREIENIQELISVTNLITLADLFSQKKISNQGLAKALAVAIDNPDQEIMQIVEKNGLLQINDDSALEAFVSIVLEANPKIVEDYKSGKVQVIGFLIGQCMKESKGKGNPTKFKQMIEARLA
jgi:aspartyl-tRNA(Asn)/glutamyl-tRNA(Gln) amidotransferase subunit B